MVAADYMKDNNKVEVREENSASLKWLNYLKEKALIVEYTSHEIK